MVHLGFHAPETLKAYFFGVKTEQWYCKLYNLDEPTEEAMRDSMGREVWQTVAFHRGSSTSPLSYPP